MVQKKTLLTCPVTGHLEAIEVQQDPATGRILQVLRCSAFTPADIIRCEELCAKRLNARLGSIRPRRNKAQDDAPPEIAADLPA